MPLEIAKLEFLDAVSDDEVFMLVSIIENLVGLLVTMRHSGDIDICLPQQPLRQMIAVLEDAVTKAADPTHQAAVAPVTIRHSHVGSMQQTTVSIDAHHGYIHLRLTLEGDPDEDDEVQVAVGIDECLELLHGLRQAVTIVEHAEE